MKTMVWRVLLYGSEAWTLKTSDIKRLESFEMWLWRKRAKISWVAWESQGGSEVSNNMEGETEKIDWKYSMA